MFDFQNPIKLSGHDAIADHLDCAGCPSVLTTLKCDSSFSLEPLQERYHFKYKGGPFPQ